jgi:uroporphyrinogen decarboxylase
LISSRERCIRSILLEDPDRVPLTLRARPELHERLRRALGIQDEAEEGLLRTCRALGVDTIAVGLGLKGGYLPEDAELKEGPYGAAYTVGYRDRFEIRRDIWGVESIWASDHTYTYTFISHPLRTTNLEQYVWPEIDEESIGHVRKMRRRHEDLFLQGGVTHMWEIAWQLTGFAEIMRMMFTEPSKVERILDGLHKLRMEEASILCDEGADVITDGDDVGMQKGMMMSPEMWRRFLKPRYAELINLCHRKGAFFFFHSDGWIEPIIPDLIEIGVDILNPVQPECMNPAKLKELYGDKLCFDGTIGVQSTLPFGSPEDVAREVKERISTLGPTGLILGPTHAMQPDVPIENILTLYRTALRYGRNAKPRSSERRRMSKPG